MATSDEETHVQQTFFIDKTGWPDGPWMTEPDRVDWQYNGLPCLIVRHQDTGTFCGYVGVPREHPWHGAAPDNIEALVHGGVTYAGRRDAIDPGPVHGEQADRWWIGFHCWAAEDRAPAIEARHPGFGALRTDKYRDLEYVKIMVDPLAVQALAASR
jgi:hypothetical protein